MLRIIAGEWRGRVLQFPDAEGLRPTGGRIRETLFNWLQPEIRGAYCLDLFAGSGALSFEALSRAAAEVVMIEKNRAAATALLSKARLLKTEDCCIVHNQLAQQYIANAAVQFDLVFLDPPFSKKLHRTILQLLVDNDCLKPAAKIYVEWPKTQDIDDILSSQWRIIRHGQAGKVEYGLIERQG